MKTHGRMPSDYSSEIWEKYIMNVKQQKRGQLMYIFQAGLEYLISILVAGSYLATLTKELGFSDSLTGILSSVISLGCLFQLLSIFIRRRAVKSLVIVMSISNQLLFMFLYVVPVIDISSQAKTIVFVISIFLAYLIYNIAHPKKINWLMSLVDDHHRGQFTANKEIISLLAGMAFSYGMGALVDHFAEHGRQRTAFILSAVVIFVLMLLHTASMLLAPEPVAAKAPRKNILTGIKEVLNNRNVLHVTVIFVLYYISTYVATPFYGTYLINELSFNLKLVSALTIVSSLLRILVSRFWGKYADKTSFTNMIQKCLLVLGLSYLCAACATPTNGKIMFALYYGLHGMALGGINSALINLVFDYVSVEKRSDSLAICQAASGVAGFLATLAASPLIAHIQTNGNNLLGIEIYAQQVVSWIAFGVIVITIIYIRLFVVGGKKHGDR